MPSNLYYHAGDIGDLVYGLIVPKLHSGGHMWLGPKHTLPKVFAPRCGITWEGFQFIAPLLRKQPYVFSLEWVLQRPFVTYDLNLFRLHWTGAYVDRYEKRGWKPPYSLQQMHLGAFDLNDDGKTPWLEAKAVYGPPVLFARSERYHNTSFPWQRIRDKYQKCAAFVGRDVEYDKFCREFGPVARLRVEDAWQLACLMAGCRLFVGNQSAPYAIAEGLKVRTIQETRNGCNSEADCMFNRPGAQFVMNDHVELPDI